MGGRRAGPRGARTGVAWVGKGAAGMVCRGPGSSTRGCIREFALFRGAKGIARGCVQPTPGWVPPASLERRTDASVTRGSLGPRRRPRLFRGVSPQGQRTQNVAPPSGEAGPLPKRESDGSANDPAHPPMRNARVKRSRVGMVRERLPGLPRRATDRGPVPRGLPRGGFMAARGSVSRGARGWLGAADRPQTPTDLSPVERGWKIANGRRLAPIPG
jgi:hypothetical protein